MNPTGISWADMTWNPLRGCSRVSPGCTNCYAEAQAARSSAPGGSYEGLAYYAEIRDGMKRRSDPRWTGAVRLVPKMLSKPLSKRRPQRVFVCSMSDLFHDRVRPEWLDQVFAVMALATQHTFIVLTKRPERMRNYLDESPPTLMERWRAAALELNLPGVDLFSEEFRPDRFPLPNVVLGVSVEDHVRATERVRVLLGTPAAARAVSYEPALGWVDFTRLGPLPDGTHLDALRGLVYDGDTWLEERHAPRIDWLIVGGESSQTEERMEFVRRFDLDWARRLVVECRDAEVPLFVKQAGAKPRDSRNPSQAHAVIMRHPRGEDPREWPAELRVHDVPNVPPVWRVPVHEPEACPRPYTLAAVRNDPPRLACACGWHVAGRKPITPAKPDAVTVKLEAGAVTFRREMVPEFVGNAAEAGHVEAEMQFEHLVQSGTLSVYAAAANALEDAADDPEINEAGAALAIVRGESEVRLGPPRQAARISRAALRVQAAAMGLPDPAPPGSAMAEFGEVEGLDPYPEVVALRFTKELVDILLDQHEIGGVRAIAFDFDGFELVAKLVTDDTGELAAVGVVEFVADGEKWRSLVGRSQPLLKFVPAAGDPVEIARCVSFRQSPHANGIALSFEVTADERSEWRTFVRASDMPLDRHPAPLACGACGSLLEERDGRPWCSSCEAFCGEGSDDGAGGAGDAQGENLGDWREGSRGDATR